MTDDRNRLVGQSSPIWKSRQSYGINMRGITAETDMVLDYVVGQYPMPVD